MGLRHPAVPLEQDAFLDHHQRRLDVSEDPRGALELHALGADDGAHHLAADLDLARPDVPRDAAPLPNDERVRRGDVALEAPVQHDGAFEAVAALDLRIFVDEGGEALPAHWLTLATPHGGLGLRSTGP